MSEQQEIRDWLINWVNRELNPDNSEINTSAYFSELGLDSMAGITLLGDLEKYMDTELNPSMFLEFSSIDKLSEYLAGLKK